MICPFCQGSDVVKRGVRQKKFEKIQLYFCNFCQKKITPGPTRGKTFPLRVILEVLSYYNQFASPDKIVERVKDNHGLSISRRNISAWLKDFKDYLPFLRMRDFIRQKYDPREMTVSSRMFHNQVYDFCYHRAKLDCIMAAGFYAF